MSISKEEILTSYIKEHMPALVLLGAEVVSASESEVLISAPLAKNHNHKGTAFGGSQFVLCIAASWCLAFLNAQAEGIEQPNLIGADGNIKYTRSVRSKKILARASANLEEMKAFREAIREKRKPQLTQRAIVENGEGKKATEFQITYVLFPR
jgi:thioesterase domain-containing protein